MTALAYTLTVVGFILMLGAGRLHRRSSYGTAAAFHAVAAVILVIAACIHIVTLST